MENAGENKNIAKALFRLYITQNRVYAQECTITGHCKIKEFTDV